MKYTQSEMKETHFVRLLLLFSYKVDSTNNQRNRSRKYIPDDPEEVLSCDYGWYPFGEMCYKLGATKRTSFMTWEKARHNCEELKGNLASIHSKKLHDFLQIFLQQKIKSHVWIGLNDHKTEGKWEWEDGTPTDFLYWDDNEPNIKNHEEDCVIMYYEGPHRVKEYGVWHDWHCDGDCSFICQKKKRKGLSLHSDPRLCPDGGWKYETSCYHLIKSPKSWSEAEKYCIKEHQGHLVTILDEATNRFIQYMFGSTVDSAWLGIKINSEVFQQKWESGWLVSYTMWDRAPQDCIAFVSSGKWISAACEDWSPFICEVSTISPPSMPPAPEGSYCPKIPTGWRDLGGEKCYFIEKKNFVSWHDANFRCLRMGGVLTSIHSQNESSVILNFVKGAKRAIYIGLHRSTLLGEDFAWSDGSPLDYINWNPNEPSYSGEQCGELLPQNARWNDVSCTDGRGYICSVLKMGLEKTSSQNTPPSSGYSLAVLLSAMFGVLCFCIFVAILVYFCCLRSPQQNADHEDRDDQYEEMDLKR